MLSLIPKSIKWKLLKSGKRFSNQFMAITVTDNDKDHIDGVIAMMNICPTKVHIVNSVSYNFPDKLEPDEILHGTLEIPIEIKWSFHFYDEWDWISVQLIR